MVWIGWEIYQLFSIAKSSLAFKDQLQYQFLGASNPQWSMASFGELKFLQLSIDQRTWLFLILQDFALPEVIYSGVLLQWKYLYVSPGTVHTPFNLTRFKTLMFESVWNDNWYKCREYNTFGVLVIYMASCGCGRCVLFTWKHDHRNLYAFTQWLWL